MSLEQQIVEKVQVLDGSRGDARRKAVRVEDLQGLLRIKERLTAQKAAGAAPTAAEFDALLDDVAYINNRLVQIMEALRAHLLP